MITYPVNVQTDRFTFIRDGVTYRNRRWPREDGQAIANPEPGLVIMQEVVAANPAYNAATHKLNAGSWTDDPANQVATFSRQAVPLTAEEIAANADNTDRAAKRALVVQAIPVLRQWAADAAAVTVTSGNAVAVLQTIVTRLSTFFNRFADLLEAQRIDQ